MLRTYLSQMRQCFTPSLGAKNSTPTPFSFHILEHTQTLASLPAYEGVFPNSANQHSSSPSTAHPEQLPRLRILLLQRPQIIVSRPNSRKDVIPALLTDNFAQIYTTNSLDSLADLPQSLRFPFSSSVSRQGAQSAPGSAERGLSTTSRACAGLCGGDGLLPSRGREKPC